MYTMLIRANIKYYRPKFMVKKTDPKTYCVSVEAAIKEAIELMNGIDGLSDQDKKLRTALKKLLNLKVNELEKVQYEAFLNEIYQLIYISGRSKRTEKLSRLEAHDNDKPSATPDAASKSAPIAPDLVQI